MKRIIVKSPLHRRIIKLPKAIIGAWKLNKGVPIKDKIRWALFQIRITVRK